MFCLDDMNKNVANNPQKCVNHTKCNSMYIIPQKLERLYCTLKTTNCYDLKSRNAQTSSNTHEVLRRVQHKCEQKSAWR